MTIDRTKTISRSATRRIAAIKAKNLRCVAHTRRYDYDGHDCDPVWAWKALAGHRARLTVDDDGCYTIHTDSRDWYELTEIA